MMTARVTTLIFILVICNTKEASSFKNPVIFRNHPDPGVLDVSGEYYVMVTTSDYADDPNSEDAFPILKSEDLVDWEQVGHVFPAGQWPPWASRDMWAPEIHLAVDSCFRVYFTARSAATGRLSLGTASSCGSPFGPYTDLGQPQLENETIGILDSHFFRDPISNKSYLMWKIDGNAVPGGAPTPIYARELSDNGVTFVPDAPQFELIRNDLDWEQHEDETSLVEAAWMIWDDLRGYYYLFYSSQWFNTVGYNVGVARSTCLGPDCHFEKRTSGPILSYDKESYDQGLNTTFVGPGHCSVVSDRGGERWMVYHAWTYDHVAQDPGRVVLLDRIGFDEEDWPTVGLNGHPTVQDQEVPQSIRN